MAAEILLTGRWMDARALASVPCKCVKYWMILSGATPCTQKVHLPCTRALQMRGLGKRHATPRHAYPGKIIFIQPRQYAPRGRPAY